MLAYNTFLYLSFNYRADTEQLYSKLVPISERVDKHLTIRTQGEVYLYHKDVNQLLR